MAANKNRGPYKPEEQKFQKGETVLILRPHLWGGCSGEVVDFVDGLHRVKITAKPDGATQGFFHSDIPGSMLETYL